MRNGYLSSQHTELWTGESILLAEAPFSDGLEAVRRGFDGSPPEWSAQADKQPGPFPVLMAGNFGRARSTLLELRGFDQGFAHYGDDNDLAFRSRRPAIASPSRSQSASRIGGSRPRSRDCAADSSTHEPDDGC